MKRFLSFCILVFIAAPLLAYNPTPIIYERTLLTITPPPAPAKEPMAKDKTDTSKKESNVKPTEILPALPRTSKEFNVEVRPLAFLNQNDFIAMQPFTDKEGMLILIQPTQQIALKSANLLAKVDVLFVSEDGLITKIAPDLSLPALEEPIDSEKPIRAFLFLKNGTAKLSDIKPGDHIENGLFKSHPVVLE